MKLVSIVGLSPSSRDAAFAEVEGDMWSVNTGHFCFTPEQLSRFTAWFQLHPRREFEMANKDRPQHLEWLKTCDIPVYMERQWDDIPTSVRYPREEIFNIVGLDYFTSSVAYMIALAIYQKYDEIHLYGIDMPSQTEYFNERPCVEFWLGVAMANDINVYMPDKCPLLRGRKYAETVKITSSLVAEKIRLHQQNREKKLADFNEAIGIAKAYEQAAKYAPDSPEIQAALVNAHFRRDVLGAEFNAYAGAVQALTELYIDALRPEQEEAAKLRSMAGNILLPQLTLDGAQEYTLKANV